MTRRWSVDIAGRWHGDMA